MNIVGMGEAATTPPYYRPLDKGIIIIIRGCGNQSSSFLILIINIDPVVDEVRCINVPSNDVNDDDFVFQIELVIT